MKEISGGVVVGFAVLTFGLVGVAYVIHNRPEDHTLLYTCGAIALVGALAVPSLANAIGAGVKIALELAPWKKDGGDNAALQ